MSFVLEEQDMRGLSEDQKVAIMEALVIAVFADGKAKPAEGAKFEAEVGRIPWGLPGDKVTAHLKSVKDRVLEVARTHDQKGVTSMVENIAKKLPDADVRAKVFRTMTAVMGAGDGLTVAEKNAMIGFATVFELSLETLDEIKAAMIAAGE